ncbi:NAD-dependent epimerase/dehydratase family protein [Vibrio sp. ZSDZ65]|uniref:NAD-dependent epimerase/dehydratase family protein n=1 Tax=Vibrio qingdaonensis TaxID=2829491 RepID=A0A9X3HV82_9VIBR|nr:NAD-dependent epimerase/dehydratase family protein [Vibrio qingdaonensis]MCW8345021.1 NAD-dependent epimerase/dehydratase family protein [Vibrio qingdaonensis]
MNGNHILIVGAGWLGLPLSKALISRGYPVTATRTSQQGCEALAENGIDNLCLDLNTLRDESDELALTNQLVNKQITTIIGCFPPGFRQGGGARYASQWNQLCQVAKRLEVDKIMMISSTTVYPETAELMTEDMARLPIARGREDFTAKSIIMLTAEEHVRNSTLDYAILRCSGLFGPQRHPSRFASKLKSVSDQASANMLHLDDAIHAIIFSLENIHSGVVNATTPTTCDKVTFYRAALRSAGLDTSLNLVNSEPGKTISSEKLQRLGYHFKYQHVLDAL